jgi:hypothetical protein
VICVEMSFELLPPANEPARLLFAAVALPTDRCVRSIAVTDPITSLLYR